MGPGAVTFERGSEASKLIAGPLQLLSRRMRTVPFAGPLFFYQNQFGSRVYFDELGPPWPKHPCTDQSGTRTGGSNAEPAVSPTLRSNEEISIIDAWLGHAGWDPQQEFFSTYRLTQWDAYRVLARVRAARRCLLVLDSLASERRRLYVAAPRKIASSLGVGSLVFYYRHWISHFDVQAMAPVESEVDRFSSAAAFIEAIVQGQSPA